jgi:hypothetical protein
MKKAGFIPAFCFVSLNSPDFGLRAMMVLDDRGAKFTFEIYVLHWKRWCCTEFE